MGTIDTESDDLMVKPTSDIFTAVLWSEDKMTQLIENNPAVQAAYEELQRFSSNAEMREFERRRRRFQEDTRIYVGAARAEGKAEGKAERDHEIVHNMKRKGYGIEAIAELTGLSHVEIERLV